MIVEIPTIEILIIVATFFTFKWLFRFMILLVIGKLISGLKEKGSNSLKDFKEKMGKGEQD